MSPYTVTLTIPRRLILHSNQRLHWSPKAERTKAIRTLAAMASRGCPRLQQVALAVRITWPDRRRRDAHNMQPTLKACIDGQMDSGLLRDDSDHFIRAMSIATTDPDPSVAGVRLAFEWTPA